MLDFPITPQEVTPEWLTGVLRQKTEFDKVTVTSLDIEMFNLDAGLSSRLARINLHYDPPASMLPQSLIGKFPHFDPQRRKSAADFRTLEGEVRFYQEIAPFIEMRTPKCYFGRYDEISRDFLLLLEDLSAGRLLQHEAMTFEVADILIEQLARFHAQWWNRPQVLEMNWLPMTNYLNWLEIMPPLFPRFMEKHSSHVSADFPQIIARLLAQLPTLAHRETDKPFTIMHGDYGTTNMFAMTDATSPEIAIIDWGIAGRGNGAFDVAFFMIRSLSIDERHNWGNRLLQRYHTTLLEQEVEGYTFADFMTNYRWEVLAGFIRGIGAASFLDPVQSPDKFELYFKGNLPRYHAAYIDHKLEQLA